MALKPNPYQVPTQFGNSVGQGMSNIAQVMMADPGQGVRDAEARGWDVRKTRDDLYEQQEQRVGRSGVAAEIEAFDPGATDFRQIYGNAVRTGALDVPDVNRLVQGLMGNAPDASDDQRIGALVGAGSTVGANSAVSEGMWDQLQERSGGAQSRDQLLASIYQDKGPEAAEAARKALYNESGSGLDLKDEWLMRNRIEDLQSSMGPALDKELVSRGLWVAQNGDLMNEYVPPGLRAGALDRAMSMYQEDREAGRVPRPMQFYVSEALGDARFEEATEGGWGPFGGEEVLRFVDSTAPAQGGDVGGQPAGGSMPMDTTVILGPDGSRISPAEVRKTAQEEGISEEEVIRQLGLIVKPGA